MECGTGQCDYWHRNSTRCVGVNGDVRLILADDCNLTVTAGIQVNDNDDNSQNGSTNTLTIYGQSTGDHMGKLSANWREYDAAIGGSNKGESSCAGTITINGGIINVTGKNGAGIGSGGPSSCAGGIININGGIVNATSIGDAAAIGGGKVEATGSNGGAGIYCGEGSINISDGTIIANGGNCSTGVKAGAGIGGEENSKITISGGSVTANGGNVTATPGTNGVVSGVGIGNVILPIDGVANAGITFKTQQAGETGGNAVIFASSISNQSGKAEDAANPWSGVIFEGEVGKVYGTNVTPTENFIISAGKVLTIDGGKALNIPDNVTLTNNGKIYVDGTFTGTADNLYYPLALVDANASGDISAYNSKIYGKAGSKITLTIFSKSSPILLGDWDELRENICS